MTGAPDTLPHRTLVVVGHGMVAQHLLAGLAERGGLAEPDRPGGWTVEVFAEEDRPAYDRVALSSVFSGTDPEALSVVPAGFFDHPALRLHLADPVDAVDLAGRTVTARSGRAVRYDRLVLATGSAPFVPPLPGTDLDGVFVYRTLDDLAAIGAYAEACRGTRTEPTGAVLGGGLLGLEAANALLALGLRTTVVELAPRLMPVQLDEGGGAMLRRHVEALGITVRTATRTAAMTSDGAGAVAGLRLAPVEAGPDGRLGGGQGGDGTETLPVDLVVVSAGIRPRDELARACGLAVGDRGGIVVDERCRTSDPAVSAVGECALAQGRTWGLVAPGYAMADTVADELLAVAGMLAGAEPRTFLGADMSTKLKLLGVDVASVGDAFGTTPDALALVWNDPTTRVYKKLVVSDDSRRVLGAVLVGDAAAYGMIRSLASARAELPGAPEAVLFPGAGGAASGVGPAALPADAVVCSCHTVTKGTICAAVTEGGARDVGALKACTKAGTGCGSCVPVMSQLLAGELATLGITVDRSLCEHFPYTRRELFDIIRVERITTFTDLVQRYGSGRGCDICKPAAASILATQAPAHVLAGENAALQDTNDHVMANMQRNGTYSVVPRMPGGEVTPEGLIAVGEVARDFGLYTKVTGGQRIDMFGARLEQLPHIWRRLVAAGFESGHAYGKSLRTVKSCVGKDWCRFGVQDSTGLAVLLELRYRGLRAPHKLKSAVSGCARECAEAQSKDFGIIATEQGWNLYVGGNGGMRPRHADLLATDLDTETLVRYIDRYLMYYVRTADRLQRTSVWLESLGEPGGPSGLDHLRAVVVEDSLGLATSLEADMAAHVAGYEDEWAATLRSPERLRRFTSFVNAPRTRDPGVQWVTERGQIRPATPAEVTAGLGRPRTHQPEPRPEPVPEPDPQEVLV